MVSLANKVITLGIDLGTTFSGATSVVDGMVKHIFHDDGHYVMPSVVAFTETECLVGAMAEEQRGLNRTNTVFDSKRMIGRDLNDLEVKRFAKFWPFDLSEDEHGQINISVTHKNEPRSFIAEQISGIILSRLKELAEEQLGQSVTNFVVTVPARFNARQRNATKTACSLAQLHPCTLFQEPTAAALAYIQLNTVPDASVILVYDLGGGTFDISVIEKSGGILDVKCTDGDQALGGRDFDNRLMEFVRSRFEQRHKCKLDSNPAALATLQVKCSQAKLRLSSCERTILSEYKFHGNINLMEEVTRAEFEQCNLDLFQETMEIVQRALAKCNLRKEDIYKVIVVGGCTRIPKIRSLLRQTFSDRQLDFSEHPDMAIQEGAARYALNMVQPPEMQLRNHVIRDVIPRSVGVSDFQGKMVKIINTYAPLPAKGVHYATTCRNNQTNMDLDVYEGEETLAKNNVLLNQFNLSGIRQAAAGKALVCVELHYNTEALLTVTATDTLQTGVSKTLTINVKDKRISAAVREGQTVEVQSLARSDQRRRATGEQINELQALAFEIRNDSVIAAGGPEQRQCDEVLAWIDSNREVTVSEITERMRLLQALRRPAVELPP